LPAGIADDDCAAIHPSISPLLKRQLAPTLKPGSALNRPTIHGTLINPKVVGNFLDHHGAVRRVFIGVLLLAGLIFV